MSLPSCVCAWHLLCMCGLLIVCVSLVVLFGVLSVVSFVTIDINATGVIFEKGFIEEESEFISLISEEKSRNIMLKSGKLSSELASIYIYFVSHVLLIKSISDLCGVCH